MPSPVYRARASLRSMRGNEFITEAHKVAMLSLHLLYNFFSSRGTFLMTIMQRSRTVFTGDMVSGCHRKTSVARCGERGKLFSIFLSWIFVDKFSDLCYQSCSFQSLVPSSPDKASILTRTIKQGNNEEQKRETCSMWPHKKDEQRSLVTSHPYLKSIFRVLTLNLHSRGKRYSSWSVLQGVVLAVVIVFPPVSSVRSDNLSKQCDLFFWETNPLAHIKFQNDTPKNIPVLGVHCSSGMIAKGKDRSVSLE